jgi:hypothetical protein
MKFCSAIVHRTGWIEPIACEVFGVPAGHCGAGEPVIDGGENIDTPDGVPGLHPRCRIADQQHLPAWSAVLLVRRSEARGQLTYSRVIRALALPHRVRSEHEFAKLRQRLTALLIRFSCLAIQAMSHLEQDGGIGRFAGVGMYRFAESPVLAGSRKQFFRRGTPNVRSCQPSSQLSGVRSGMPPTSFQNVSRTQTRQAAKSAAVRILSTCVCGARTLHGQAHEDNRAGSDHKRGTELRHGRRGLPVSVATAVRRFTP